MVAPRNSAPRRTAVNQDALRNLLRARRLLRLRVLPERQARHQVLRPPRPVEPFDRIIAVVKTMEGLYVIQHLVQRAVRSTDTVAPVMLFAVQVAKMDVLAVTLLLKADLRLQALCRQRVPLVQQRLVEVSVRIIAVGKTTEGLYVIRHLDRLAVRSTDTVAQATLSVAQVAKVVVLHHPHPRLQYQHLFLARQVARLRTPMDAAVSKPGSFITAQYLRLPGSAFGGSTCDPAVSQV